MKDLILLVPDVSIEKTVCAILEYRRQALHIRELSFDCIRWHGRDGGVRKHAHTILQLHREKYRNAVVIFDHHGCGEEDQKTACQIENDVMSNLVNFGWNDNNALVVVIEPELEAWVWSDSPWVAKVVEWLDGDTESLKLYVKGIGFQFDHLGKPVKPKEALEQVLRKTGIPYSASNFKRMAEKVSWRYCEDRSFLKLKNFLCQRFSRE